MLLPRKVSPGRLRHLVMMARLGEQGWAIQEGLQRLLIDGEGKSLFDEINFLGLIAQHGHGDRRSVGAAAAAAVALASTSGWGAARNIGLAGGGTLA